MVPWELPEDVKLEKEAKALKTAGMWNGLPAAALAMILTGQGCVGTGETDREASDEVTTVEAPVDRGPGLLQSGDYEQAAALFRKAAEQDDAAAQFTLGVLYALGVGVPADDAAALAWYRKAAGNAGAEAQYNLAEKLAGGVPGRVNDAIARGWIERLSRLGQETNPLRVGSDYPFGVDGLRENPAEALEWYTRAAEQAHVMSWYRLGRMHVGGRGVAADRVRAHMWLGLCAELGLGDATNWVARLEETMTQEQLAASAELAARWKASTPEPRPLPARGEFDFRHGGDR